MLAKAILVHGVIGYKFCWLLPDDKNQGTPAGHESNGTTVRDHWEDMNHLRQQLGTYHLDIAMLLLLGDTSPMFRFVSATFGLPGLGVWWWMIWCHLTFLICHTFDAILGHILVLVESYRSSWSYMITPTCEMRIKTMMCSLSYHDPLVEPLWSHSTRPTFFGICMSSCFLFHETFPRCLGLIWITEIAHLMMNDFMSPDFWPIVHLMPY